ncbi:ABC transporter substrate-binding protein [Dactylosporangium sp. NPDC000555]|uniref:ABC transporter substrate-binding protein n=1 Tax=Dactylosporangium sp. NPDC000555 TaxID=3154260 RepID=UPI00331D8F70
MADSGFRLGIDFGTSNTVAVLRWPDGRAKPLLFDGSPLLPSAVYVNADGTILTGRDAVHSARLQPHRFEPYPKRRVEEGTVWLGERDVPVGELVTSVLRRVATEAERVAGAKPSQVMITHPATWPPQRRQTLSQAAVAAGLPAPLLSAEPVAAASYFVGTVGTHVPVGGIAVVYDFGAGTFDASVVRRNAGGGFDVLASEGLPDAGGLDVDAAVVAYLGRNFTGREGDQWRRLTNPESETDRRTAWQLWEDARLAKEMLSRAATTYVHVPLFDESVPIGREQLEQLARPILDRTVTATQIAVTAAALGDRPVSAVFLVGGSSRIPLAATLLHRAMGIAPTAIEQPELVVAEGALHLAPPTGRAPVSGVAGGAPSPISGPPISGVPGLEPSGDVAAAPVSASPVSGQPVSPAFSMPSNTPHLPPLLQTSSMPAVPPQPTSPPAAPPVVPQVVPPVVPSQPTSPPPQHPAGFPPKQHPAFPPQQRPPAQPAMSTVPAVPTQPAAYAQPRPPVAPPQPVTGPPAGPAPAWQAPGSAQPMPAQPMPLQPMPGQPVSGGYAPPGVLPPRKRNGGLIAAAGVGALALLLVIGGIVWLNRDGNEGGGGGDPSKQAAPAVSPACGHKIGYIGTSSGDNSDDGVMMRNSVKLAIDDFNATHSNCRVDFKEFDTTGTDEGSRKQAQNAVGDPEVIGVVGPVYDNEILAAGPILNRANVPMIVPFAPGEKLAKQGWAMFHRIIGSDEDQARAGARYLRNTLKAKKTAIVYDDSDFGRVGRQQVSNELGSATGLTVQIHETDTDFTSEVKQVTDSNPDAVYFAGQSKGGIAFVKALRTAKPDLPVVGSDRLFTQGFVKNTEGKAEGVIVTCPCVPSKEAGGDFASKYQGAFGAQASYYGPEAYDAAGVFLAGFLAGKGTRDEMVDFLSTYNAKGAATGRQIKFDGSGNLSAPNPLIWAYKVQGKYMVKESVIQP